MRTSRANRRYRRWTVLILALGWTIAACSDDPEPETPELAYVSANPPSPPLISIQGATLDEQDWPIAEPQRPDQGHIRPYFSPDGDRIAFERRVPDGDDRVGRLFVVDTDGSGTEQLTDLGHDEACQLWPRGWDSAGGTIAFVCVSVDDQPRRVGVVDLDGEIRLFDPASAEYTDIRWLNDDNLVVIARDTTDETYSLRRIDRSGQNDDPVAEFDDQRPLHNLRVSPDGDRVAASRAVDPNSGDALRPESSLIVTDLDGGQWHSLLDDQHGSTATGPHVVKDWHPDGRQLLVATGGYTEPGGPLRLIDADDETRQTRLVDPDELADGTIRRAEIAPDGDLVVFSDNDADDDAPMRWTRGSIRLVDIDGDNPERLDDLSVADETNQPTFNPAAW